MGKTKRHEPRNGEFRKLKASKKQRNKKQRSAKANLRNQLQFASEHRANRNLSKISAAMYANKATAEDFDPSTFDPDKPNDETLPENFEPLDLDMIKDLHEQNETQKC